MCNDREYPPDLSSYVNASNGKVRVVEFVPKHLKTENMLTIFKRKYPALSFWENYFGGHISIGPLTLYGRNAMNWAGHISTRRWGYICFTLPAIARFRRDRNGKLFYDWYIYLSPNATPWACTFYRGRSTNEKIRAQIRKLMFGHGFDTGKHKIDLYAANQKYGEFWLSQEEKDRAEKQYYKD